MTAPHSRTLAWQIPWTEEPGGLQSMGSWRVGHDWAMTSLSLFTFMHWRRKWQPTPVFLPGESQGRGSLVGCCLWGHTESDTTEATLQQQQQQESVEEEKKTPKFWPEQLGRWCHLLRWGRLGRCESKFHFEHVKYDRYRSTWICPDLIHEWGRSREKEMATHSSILVWRIPWTEATAHGVAKSWTWLSN